MIGVLIVGFVAACAILEVDLLLYRLHLLRVALRRMIRRTK